MQKKSSDELLEFVIFSLLLALEELSSVPNDNLFCYGEKTAYVECLEWLQKWEKAEIYGLNFNVEKRFPL